MANLSLSPSPILQFFNNLGQPNSGGTLLTQVGGVNYATYQDPLGATPLPNPIPLNSRGEVSNSSGVSSQLFLASGVTYTFTLYDSGGNQLNQATYVAPSNIYITESTISTGQSLAIGNTQSRYVATTALTLTLAQSTALSSTWYNEVYAYGGVVTITPNAADKINGGTVGASMAVPLGYTARIYTDASGNIYVSMSQVGVGTVTLASASTIDLGATGTNTIAVSGTGTITSLGTTAQVGQLFFVNYTGACTLTQNATSLQLIGATTRTNNVGDSSVFQALGSGNFKEIVYSNVNTVVSAISQPVFVKQYFPTF